MIADSKRFTPPSLRNARGKASPIRPKSGIMSLDLEVADAIQRQEQSGSPRTSRMIPEDILMAAGDESVDEDAIKESPPRGPNRSGSGRSRHSRQSSEPRPLGEMMDEVEEAERLAGAGSPSLRHVRGKLEEQHSWEKDGERQQHPFNEGTNGTTNGMASPPPTPARAHPTLIGNIMDPNVASDGQMCEGGGVGGMSEERVKQEGLEHISEEGTTSPSDGNAPPTTTPPLGIFTNGNGNGVAAKHAIHGARTPETYEAVGEDESLRSPIRKAHKRVSSRSLNGSAKKQHMQSPSQSDSFTPQARSETADSPQSGREAKQDDELSPKSTKAPAFLSLDNSSADEAQTQQSQIPAREDKAEPGEVIYESLRNSSGENLASIKPDNNYGLILDLAQRESRPPALPDRKPNTISHKRGDSELVSGRRAGAGWSRSAIRWAPLNMPLQRRLQTCMVLLHTLSIAGGLALFFLLCTIPLLWPILLPYLLYVLLSRASIDGKLSQRSDWLRRSKIWSLFAGYFPARLHRTQELEPTRKYVFGYHPHGIISHGAFAAFATEALGFSQLFPGITNTLLTLDANVRIPLYRDYALRMGLASVSRESCENLLSHGGPNNEGMGRAITIVVGGARESLDAKPRTLRLVLKRRKGFVKLAIRSGADLVPCLSFGENDLYDQFDGARHPFVHRAQLTVKKMLGFTIPLFHARGVFNYDVGLMPYRRPINIVVGRPIRIQQARNPDPKYVDEMHEAYVTELERVWEEWKGTFARGREGEMELVE
ncbi:diacylglycerol O-acyltransferase 1 [Friedmanniomyces endolithicus]|nr:diacylglycerol O-acyltransferase 1 [Friedmanniomyces endolithicus]